MSVLTESSSPRQVGTAWRPWHRIRPPLSSFPFWRNNSRVRLALGVISLTHIPLCSFHTLRKQLLWVPHSPGQRKRPELGQSPARVHSQGWEDKQGGVSPKLISFITPSHLGTPLPHTSWRGLKLVLALKDVNKPTFKADRELSQAKREAAGLGSVLLGEMRNSGDPTSSETWVNVKNRSYLRKTFIRPPHFILCFWLEVLGDIGLAFKNLTACKGTNTNSFSTSAGANTEFCRSHHLSFPRMQTTSMHTCLLGRQALHH